MSTITTNLNKFVISNINYQFRNDVSDIKKLIPDISHEDLEEHDFNSKVIQDNSIKLATHRDLDELFVELDIRVKEEIDLSDFTREELSFIVKSIDLSVRFYFDINLDENLKSYEKNEEFIEFVRETIMEKVVDISINQSIDIIKRLSSLDHSEVLELSFPKSKYENVNYLIEPSSK
ncbi:hypothetical protein MKY22_16330 [Exiguobacterium sp. FSL W8-0210]|uniref:hypothetical protein n=1 Tax=Exiguobacterium sp. FSL W8-0210 TaxID=2921598 RepID=UPI0030F857FE